MRCTAVIDTPDEMRAEAQWCLRSCVVESMPIECAAAFPFFRTTGLPVDIMCGVEWRLRDLVGPSNSVRG